MANKRAKVLEPEQLATLLSYIDANSALPERDRLIVLLSFKAGLRVAEIAKIDFAALTDVEGRIAKTIHVFSNVAKKKREREVPMHPEIKNALAVFRRAYPDAPSIAFSSQPYRFACAFDRQRRVMKPMAVNSLTQYLGRLMRKAGFTGASSHSGRRTFATDVSRKLASHHSSLRDLQKLLGHARLDTTERYLEPSNDTFNLVAAI